MKRRVYIGNNLGVIPVVVLYSHGDKKKQAWNKPHLFHLEFTFFDGIIHTPDLFLKAYHYLGSKTH
ncbi:MAG: hypothetical protein AAGI38_23935, partial [Bacteroidota bacterium]